MNTSISRLHRLWVVSLSAVAALSLSACVVVPAHSYRAEPVYAPGPYGYDAPMAPPPPPVEVMPPAPFLGALWIAGFWSWVGGRHVWQHGHWEAPRQGQRWEPRRWEPQGGGRWSPRGGQWRDNH